MDILSKILTYERFIFEEYSSKRKNLIHHIQTLKNLDKSQLAIFVNDVKDIIDPIKTSISAIDYYFTNTDLKKNKSVVEKQELQKVMMLYLLLDFRDESSEETLEMETSESESSESDSESDSDSESRSSMSVSVTFSNKNSVSNV